MLAVQHPTMVPQAYMTVVVCAVCELVGEHGDRYTHAEHEQVSNVLREPPVVEPLCTIPPQ